MPPDRPSPFSFGDATPRTPTPPTSALRTLYGSRPVTPSARSTPSPLSASPLSISTPLMMMDCDTPDTSASNDAATPTTPTTPSFTGHSPSPSHSPLSGTLWNGSDFPAPFYLACRSLKSGSTPRASTPSPARRTPTALLPAANIVSRPPPPARPSSAPVDGLRSSTSLSSPPALSPVAAPAKLKAKAILQLPRRTTATYILSRIADVQPPNVSQAQETPAPNADASSSSSSSSPAPSSSTPPPARKQHPKAAHDLYTPRYVRGGRSAGANGEQGSKEGWCALCVVEADDMEDDRKDSKAKEGSWHNLRNSSYRYHLLRVHGVSSKTCTWLEPPINIRPAAALPVAGHELQGQCHRCSRWITFSDKPPATSWFVHAASCHRLVPLQASEPTSPSRSV